jgi:hypothetical protein
VAVPPDESETVEGFRLEVNPEGAFADNAMLPEKPQLETVIVDVPGVSWVTLILAGFAEIE